MENLIEEDNGEAFTSVYRMWRLTKMKIFDILADNSNLLLTEFDLTELPELDIELSELRM